jgi:Glycosyl hydrolases family 18
MSTVRGTERSAEHSQVGTHPGMRRRAKSWARRMAVALSGILVLVVGLGLTGWWWVNREATSYPTVHFNQGTNAVWLEHTWAGEPHSSYEYATLAQQLEQYQIRYVFAHVGPLASDGTIPQDRYPDAQQLVTQLKANDPHVRVLAWIGQLEAASGLPADETVDLTNPDVRQAIATTSAHFVKDLGFDGIHYDIEPMLNNAPHLLDLLDVTRQLLPAGAIISISTPMWAPNAHVAEWLRGLGHGAGYWTSYYYAAVATHVDQLVVMDYNTALPSGILYRTFVKQQTQNILEAVRSARHPPQVLIGLPTYHENGFWFHDAAENLANGIPGVVAGLNANRDTQPFVGLALYRFATTDSVAWQTYQRLWLGAR